MEMFLDGKSTLTHYGLDLISCAITPPRRKQYLVSIPASDGDLDLMDGLCPPRFETRTITAVFALPPGNARETVDQLINDLEGREINIVLPNDAGHYMRGKIHVSSAGALPGAEVTVSATCAPWRHFAEEVVYHIPESDVEVVYTFANAGTREVVPTVTASGELTIVYDGSSTTLSAGTYQLTYLTISGRSNIHLQISGSAAEVRYREAVL